jgi:hypothetical protein
MQTPPHGLIERLFGFSPDGGDGSIESWPVWQTLCGAAASRHRVRGVRSRRSPGGRTGELK